MPWTDEEYLACEKLADGCVATIREALTNDELAEWFVQRTQLHYSSRVMEDITRVLAAQHRERVERALVALRRLDDLAAEAREAARADEVKA
jgi:hypothetical protein